MHHHRVFGYPHNQSKFAANYTYHVDTSRHFCVALKPIESFRFEDEDEDEDEDEAFCFRHNEIFKTFRRQLGRNDEVDCNNIVTPSLSRI